MTGAPLAALAVACVVGACTLEKLPPIVMVRDGQSSPVKRVVLLPAECGSSLCRGLDQLVAGELAFRGYEVVDLQRLNAIERKRTEVQVLWTSKVGGVESSGVTRRVEVRGPTLSDVDVWTLRDELTAMGVDSIVRVRTAEIWAKPARVVALVRVTRARDAQLVASALCELEAGTFDTYEQGAERSTRCALAKVLR
jgi:hypothetical protein